MLALVLLGGCGGGAHEITDAGPEVDAGPPHDGGSTHDAGSDSGTDGGVPDDAFVVRSDAGCTISPTFADVQSTIFVGCSGPINCHGSSSFSHGAGLILSDGDVYGALVGVPSTTDPTVPRVDPGSPMTSMLFRKLIDDLPADGSLGNPMPAGEGIRWSELPPDEIELVRCWIANGAPR